MPSLPTVPFESAYILLITMILFFFFMKEFRLEDSFFKREATRLARRLKYIREPDSEEEEE